MSWRRALWGGFKRLARRIADAQARLLLAAFYYAILWPFALAIRRQDPLGLRRPRGWVARDDNGAGERERAARQY